MKDCEKYQKLMSAYIDGMLNAKEKARFEAHISGCGLCRKELERLKALVRELNSLPAEPLPDGFHEKYMLALRNIEKPARGLGFRRFAPVAVSVCLCFIILSAALLSANYISQPKYSGQTAPHAAETPAASSYAAPAPLMAPASVPSAEGYAGGEIAAAAGATVLEDSAMESVRESFELEKEAEPQIFVLVSGDVEILARTFDAEITVDNLQEAVKKIAALPADIEFSGISAANARYTLRAESYNYESIIKEITALGKVRAKRESVSELTSQYRENNIRLKAKKDEIDLLNGLISKAGNIEDILTIQRQISNLENEKAGLMSAAASFEKEAETPVIYLYLQAETGGAQSPAPQPFSSRLKKAFASSVNLTVIACETVIVAASWLLFPALIILALFFAYWLIKRRRRK